MKLRTYLVFVALYCMLTLLLSCGSKEKQWEKVNFLSRKMKGMSFC